MAGKPKEIEEHEATGEVEQIFHEVKQVFRVTGVNLVFRTWAGFERFFPVLWRALRPNAETRAFESAGELVRQRAVMAAQALGPLASYVLEGVRLGQSQRFQLERALELYHYVNPKLLVFTCAVRMAMDGEPVGQGGGRGAERLERGAPPRMAAMEMVDERPDEPELRALFKDIRRALEVSSVNSDFRTLALWPEYLDAAWGKLAPLAKREDYLQAADTLRDTARAAARALPYPVDLSREQVAPLGEDVEAIMTVTRRFERVLALLILDIALLALDALGPDALSRSPYEAAASPGAEEFPEELQ